MVKAVVGANWGDEGKGRIVDLLTEKADYVVRYWVKHPILSLVFREEQMQVIRSLMTMVSLIAYITIWGIYNHTTSVIGNGVALNIPVLFKEIEGIVSQGVPRQRS